MKPYGKKQNVLHEYKLEIEKMCRTLEGMMARARKGGEHKMKCETGLSFGQAIEAMKAGKRCSRVGWKNYQYIELATDISYKDAHGDVVNTNGHYAIAFVDMCGLYIGWSPSQSDMFAWDWQIVGE